MENLAIKKSISRPPRNSIEKYTKEGEKVIHKGQEKKKYTASPLNYIGGKYRIIDQIMPFIPDKINTFVDLFAGGFNIGINVEANKIICNDYVFHIIELYKEFKRMGINEILSHIDNRIAEFELSKENEDGYKRFRDFYNIERKPLDLYVLICFSFNYQIRFNSKHEYNNPFGRNRSSFNKTLKKKLIKFKEEMDEKNIEFIAKNFKEFDLQNINEDDFFYCDPPYLITTGTYNDGKRGFNGWGIKEELELLKFLDNLNERGIKFALSNVLMHKGRENEELIKWSKKYNVNYIDFNYANSSYQTKDRSINGSTEVLITNYKRKEM